MSIYRHSFYSHLRAADARTVEQWCLDQRIRPPGSARGTQLDLSLTPWLKAPLEAIADNHNREVCVVAPTGAGKTTLLDASLLHATAEDGGSILLAMQNEADADGYFDERLEPMLLGLDGVGDMVRNLPRGKRRKGELVMPHMTIFVQGASLANFQRKSVRYVFLDEVWGIKHGLVAEARARHHDRWNARVVLTSQGGWQHVDTDSGRVKTELFESWERSSRNEWNMVCPQCSAAHKWNTKQIKWTADYKRQDGTYDEAAIAQSTCYECPTCSTRFPDNISTRRGLANASRYVETNPGYLRQPGHHVGFRCAAPTLYYVAWSTLALEFLKAAELNSAGDRTALDVFTQKREAEFVQTEEDAPGVVLGGSGYLMAEYANGEPWEGELFRFLTIDRQQNHFWAVVRAWKPDGSSRLIWCGKLITIEAARELQHRLKVKDIYAFEDGQYNTSAAYADCDKYNWCALHGSGLNSFVHHPPGRRPFTRFFSPLRKAESSGRKVKYIHWSSDKVKDILARHRGGHGPSWEVGDDIGLDYQTQLNSEVKKDMVNKVTKQIQHRWVKIGSRPNHLWDCEAMQIVAALIKGVIGADEATPEPEVAP